MATVNIITISTNLDLFFYEDINVFSFYDRTDNIKTHLQRNGTIIGPFMKAYDINFMIFTLAALICT